MDYFAKKQWIRIVICALAVAAVTLVMTGVFNGNEPLKYSLTKDASAASATEAEATEQGFGGEVTVHVSLDENQTIQALSIDTPDETDGLGKRASEAEFTDQFIGKSGPFALGENGIEALSGATVTSTAAVKAINKAAGFETAAAEEGGETAGGGDMLSLIALSMGNEKDNSYVTDYLKQDPYLVNIYEGYGFAKDYGSARGHAYTLEDVQKTERPHAKANCLTCKTPDMHKMIAEQGVGVYSMPFEDVMAQTTNTISCYTCHGDDGGNNGQMVVTHQYVNEALGENVSEVKAASLSCGQCHIEYYFTPEDSEAMMPYHSKAEMTPEAILAYYDELGFYDWEQPGTGTKMLKAQHPELETYSYGMHASLLSCADCHMPVKTTESGAEYHDHHLVSPLNNETLLNKCAECHGSGEAISARVREIQAQVTGRESVVGNRLSALKDLLTQAVSSGEMTEEELDAVRKLHREAQWFFDFCYVENAEGAHNSALANRCLDTSEKKIDEALSLLTAAGGTPYLSSAAPETAEAAAEPEEKVTPLFAGYRAESENSFSRITVIATAKNGVLQSVKILSEGEDGKDLLTDEIKENWAKAILESGSAAPDAITSATLQFSAASVTEAMTEILDKIGGTAAAEAPAQEAAPEVPAAVEPSAEAEPAAAETPAAETAEAPAETKEEPAKTETADGDAQVYAVYRVTKENNFSKVTVTATAKNGVLADVKIASEGEQDLLTDELRTAWAKAILESGSAAPDAVTGASLTFSAASVQEAMTEILSKISGEETAAPAEETAEQPEAKEEAKPETGKTETADSDELVYAVYRSAKENSFSKVTVIVSAKNGTMTSVKILSEGEQDLLTDELREAWAKAILDSGSAAPDEITGASLTFSAASVQEAMTEILNRMAGK